MSQAVLSSYWNTWDETNHSVMEFLPAGFQIRLGMASSAYHTATDCSFSPDVRLLEHQPSFDSQEHEKAWLIVTARNVCKNELRSKRRKHLALDDAVTTAAEPSEPDETLAVLLTLPERYQTALYLYYYEGYSTAETAKLMHKNESTVRTDLARGRALLKAHLTE